MSSYEHSYMTLDFDNDETFGWRNIHDSDIKELKNLQKNGLVGVLGLLETGKLQISEVPATEGAANIISDSIDSRRESIFGIKEHKSNCVPTLIVDPLREGVLIDEKNDMTYRKENVEDLVIKMKSITQAMDESDVTVGYERLRKLLTLGKRGRFYADIWGEEKLLEKNEDLQHTVSPLKDWGDLFCNYSDSHDGYYRRWMVQTTPNERTLKTLLRKQSGLHIIPPPIPVAIQHPASWGVSNRISPTSAPLDSSKFHPACYSNSVLDPPSKQLKLCDLNEELDDDILLNEWKNKLDELFQVETANYTRIQKLGRYANIESHIDDVKLKRRYLHDLLNRSYCANKINECDRTSFISLHRSLKQTSKKNGVTSGISQPGLCRDGDRQTSRKRKLLGTCIEHHVHDAETLQHADIGDLLEVWDEDRWILAYILRFSYDGNALRHIKVQPVNGSLWDAHWIATEDGILSKLGTNLHVSEAIYDTLMTLSPCRNKTKQPKYNRLEYDLSLKVRQRISEEFSKPLKSVNRVGRLNTTNIEETPNGSHERSEDLSSSMPKKCVKNKKLKKRRYTIPFLSQKSNKTILQENHEEIIEDSVTVNVEQKLQKPSVSPAKSVSRSVSKKRKIEAEVNEVISDVIANPSLTSLRQSPSNLSERSDLKLAAISVERKTEFVDRNSRKIPKANDQVQLAKKSLQQTQSLKYHMKSEISKDTVVVNINDTINNSDNGMDEIYWTTNPFLEDFSQSSHTKTNSNNESEVGLKSKDSANMEDKLKVPSTFLQAFHPKQNPSKYHTSHTNGLFRSANNKVVKSNFDKNGQYLNKFNLSKANASMYHNLPIVSLLPNSGNEIQGNLVYALGSAQENKAKNLSSSIDRLTNKFNSNHLPKGPMNASLKICPNRNEGFRDNVKPPYPLDVNGSHFNSTLHTTEHKKYSDGQMNGINGVMGSMLPPNNRSINAKQDGISHQSSLHDATNITAESIHLQSKLAFKNDYHDSESPVVISPVTSIMPFSVHQGDMESKKPSYFLPDSLSPSREKSSSLIYRSPAYNARVHDAVNTTATNNNDVSSSAFYFHTSPKNFVQSIHSNGNIDGNCFNEIVISPNSSDVNGAVPPAKASFRISSGGGIVPSINRNL